MLNKETAKALSTDPEQLFTLSIWAMYQKITALTTKKPQRRHPGARDKRFKPKKKNPLTDFTKITPEVDLILELATKKPVASLASKVLNDPRSSKHEKQLAGSALSQVNKGYITSGDVQNVAVKVLGNPKSSSDAQKLAKSVIGKRPLRFRALPK